MEAYILQNLEGKLPAALSTLIEEHLGNDNAQQGLPWLLPFSTKLYLSVMQSHLQTNPYQSIKGC
jgi:hypothetical protein